MKYHEILKDNRQMGDALRNQPVYGVGVISNIVVNPVREILEWTLRKEGVHAEVAIGSYDNLIGDAGTFAGRQMVAVFWEPSNLVDGFQYKAGIWDEPLLEDLYARTIKQMEMLFEQLRDTPLVLLNRFSPLPFTVDIPETTRYEAFCHRINQYLEGHKPENIHLIDIGKLYACLSIEKSVDLRNFYTSKALLTIDFFRAWCRFITPFVLARTGRASKVLVFDGDNTLWGGIVGEDPFEDIKLSGQQPGGTIYEEVQAIALALGRQGVILAMNSKNNLADVIELLHNRKDSMIRPDDFTVMKVNWDDKVSNLVELARELNIGLDAMVFVDDSDFEINYVKEKLPMVKTIKVPEQRSAYPQALRKSIGLFMNLKQTREDLQRGEMYRHQAMREADRQHHTDLEDYLKSLGLRITLLEDRLAHVSRMAQLTLKTNQFNLTTRRYSEGEMKSMIEDPDILTIAIQVEDRFGDSGITGLAIARVSQTTAGIDTFLLSCRVIGRNIEYALMDALMSKLSSKGVRVVHSSYIKTTKNDQVADFFDKAGFLLDDCNDQMKRYRLDTGAYSPHNSDYISIRYGT